MHIAKAERISALVDPNEQMRTAARAVRKMTSEKEKITMKTVCQVMLKTVNEVKDFVNTVNQCAYDVDLLSGPIGSFSWSTLFSFSGMPRRL